MRIDIDESTLERNTHRLTPFATDRTAPLKYQVYTGDITKPHPCILNADAIAVIEVIEHLYATEFLEFDYNLFAYAQPKIMMFTTPNVEFNVLFDMKTQFRHDDHKFEWTREQFREWARNVCVRYPKYVVQFIDIGLGPENTDDDHIGQCSQMALFMRKDFLKSIGIDIQEFVDEQNDMYFIPTKSVYGDDADDADAADASALEIDNANLEKKSSGTDDLNNSGIVDTHNKPSTEYKLIHTMIYPLRMKQTPESIVSSHLSFVLNMLIHYGDGNEYSQNADGTYSIPLAHVLEKPCTIKDIDVWRKVINDNKDYTLIDDEIIKVRYNFCPKKLYDSHDSHDSDEDEEGDYEEEEWEDYQRKYEEEKEEEVETNNSIKHEECSKIKEIENWDD